MSLQTIAVQGWSNVHGRQSHVSLSYVKKKTTKKPNWLLERTACCKYILTYSRLELEC